MADVKYVQFVGNVLERADRQTRDIISTLAPTVRVIDIPLIPAPTASTLQVGDNVYFRLGLNGAVRIVSWSLAGTVSGVSASGTIAVDVLVGATLAAVASICGAHLPTLTAAAELTEQAVASDWDPVIPNARWIMASVSSTGGTLEVVSLTLRCAVV